MVVAVVHQTISAMSSPSYQTQGGTYTYGSGLGDTSGMGTGSNYVGP